MITGAGRLFGAYGLEYRQPVGAWQDHIQKNQMRSFLAKQLKAFLGICGLDRFVGRLQHRLQ